MVVRLIGAGAVGAPLALRLREVCDFALITDAAHADGVRNLSVNGVRPGFKVETSADAPADFVIFACKNFGLSAAMDSAASFIGKDTVILSLLNGVESEELLARRFSEQNLIYGFITNLSSNRTGNDVTCFSKDGGTIVFGEKDNSHSERLEQICALFDAAGVTYRVPDDILHEMWWKFMLNTCFNSLTGVLGLTYAGVCRNASLMRCVRMIAAEVRMTAAAEGVHLTEDDTSRMISLMTSLTDEGKTSMLQDIEAGRKNENRYFSGTVINLAARHGLAVPVTSFLYNLVEAAADAKKPE